MVKLFSVLMTAALLASCAATPMRQEQAQSGSDAQAQQIGLHARCCSGIERIEPVRISGGSVDQIMDHRSAIITLTGRPTTGALYQLPADSKGKEVEFFSYSDRKRSVFRFDSTMFIAPAFVFLDKNRQVVETQDQPPVCWGAKGGNGGLWTRASIPDGAAYVVVAARNDRNLFAIDTRQLASAGPGFEAISEARQSHVTQVGTGYTGIYSMELVEQERPRLGRCSPPAP